MIGPAETAFRALLADIAGDWPVRWPNEPWPDDILLGEGNLPVVIDEDGVKIPRPYIEAEVIGGADRLFAIGKSEDGKRSSVLPGSLRVYLTVGEGLGQDDLIAKTDAITAALKRKTIILNGRGNRIELIDPRVDDGVAGVVEGDRFTRQISAPFDNWYRL